MQIKKFITLSILIISLFSACDNKESISDSIVESTQEKVKVVKEQKLPTFHLKTTNGEDITIEVTKDGWIFKEYPNKIILLNFFATWCPPCKAEIPHLNNLLLKYKDTFQVISVTTEKDKSNEFINDFIEQYKISYPVTNSPENFNLAAAVGGISTIPTMFLFNTNGYVVQKYKGTVHEEVLDSDIQKALGQ